MIAGSPQACLQPPPTQHMEAQSGLPQPTSSAAELPPQPYHPKRKQKERQSTARPSDDHKRERYKNVGTEIGGKEGQGKQSDTKKDSRSGRGTFLEGKQTIEPGAGKSSVSRPHTPSSFADSKRKGGGQGRGTQEGRSQSDEKGSRFRREGPSGKDRRTTDTDKGVVSGASRPDSPLPSTDVVRGEAHPPKPPRAGHRARAPKFNPGLTVPDARVDSAPEKTLTSAPEKTEPIPTDSKQRESSEKRQRRPRLTTPRPHFADDLTSTLIKSLSVRPYGDCPICFSHIIPNQQIWSCSSSTPQVSSTSDNETTTIPQSCWTVFHLKCIRSWAEKSVKTLEEAWRNRGEMDKKGEWRCPGCQARRELVPTSYWCFCHSIPDPKPPRLATPHSCGNTCSRPRETGCGHACPLLCHPGPCPPCQVTMQVPCPCPRHQVVMFRCGDDISGKGKVKEDRTTREKVVSCGDVCGRLLDCGKHSCERICHTGACDACEVIEDVKCYCGRTNRLLRCGEGNALSCTIRKEDENETQTWIGRFECEHTCDRPFDCGVHHCQKSCHAPSPDPAACPFSPNKITHCPCGKHAIGSQDDSSSSTGEFTFSARYACTDPIPTCDSTCGKIHALCCHECLAKCHWGQCPSCSVVAVRPCRCGLTTKEVMCADFITEEAEKELLCDRPCRALRACGHHECGRICCPLASLAGKVKKGRVTAVDPAHTAGIGEEEGGLHECDLVCGKNLTCGNHTCERKDHRGPCPSCLRSTFEEVICPCGRTILDPPVPCGTKIECRYQCPRPTACGHQPMLHTCHEVPPQCPLCAYLTTKMCACGKKEVLNVKCSLEREKISCATACEKLLTCGFHRCQRLCHAGDCKVCTTQCGKDRKSCLPAHHPCTRPCHAPSTCPEDDPCEAVVTISCPCGRLTQFLRCGRWLSNPESSSSRVLKCNSDCELAKRNARLAEALGISDESRERAIRHLAGGPVVYSDEVMSFAKDDSKFVLLAEKTFAEFIASNKRSQVLPHMTQEKRKFVHSLAGIYRLDTQMVDQEPLRSIQILRRLDSRIPAPLLSAAMASSVGKLGLSSSSSSAWRAPSKPVSPAPAPPVPGITASGARGWGAIVNPRSTGVTVPPTITTSTSTPVPRATNIPSRSATPSLGVRVESMSEMQHRGENMDVPDNWEDDV